MRQSVSAFAGVEMLLLEQIRSAGSFEAVRHIDVPTDQIEDSLAAATLSLALLGRAQVWADVAESPRKGAALRAGRVVLSDSVEPLTFDEAVAFFRDKTSLSPEAFYALSEAARVKAFTVAVGSEDTIIAAIRDLVESALAEGMSLRDFQQRAAAVLDHAGVSMATPWYWETVYRTNLATSYHVGRWQQMTDPAVTAVRPYIRYLSARLPTSRPSHVEKHGLIYPQDHPFWDEWFPLSGFNCRCTTQSVSEANLARYGWHVSDSMDFQYPHADRGFGVNPGKVEVI